LSRGDARRLALHAGLGPFQRRTEDAVLLLDFLLLDFCMRAGGFRFLPFSNTPPFFFDRV